MTPFEQWSLIAYYLQLGLIGGGLILMSVAGRRRDKQLDQQGKILEAQNKALERMGAGIERLLERSQ